MLDHHLVFARKSTLLSGLSAKVRECLMAKARLRHYDRGTTILMQGERATSLKIIVKGWVKLYRIAPSGAEAIVDLMTKGSSFAEIATLHAENNRVSAEAVSPCTLMLLDLTDIRACPAAYAELSAAVLSAAAGHIETLLGEVERLKAQTGAQRLASFLLGLCNAPVPSCDIELPYEKHLIAGRLGMKPESLSRAFGKLKASGVTMQQNRVTISDASALHRFATQDPSLAWAA